MAKKRATRKTVRVKGYSYQRKVRSSSSVWLLVCWYTW